MAMYKYGLATGKIFSLKEVTTLAQNTKPLKGIFYITDNDTSIMEFTLGKVKQWGGAIEFPVVVMGSSSQSCREALLYGLQPMYYLLEKTRTDYTTYNMSYLYGVDKSSIRMRASRIFSTAYYVKNTRLYTETELKYFDRGMQAIIDGAFSGYSKALWDMRYNRKLLKSLGGNPHEENKKYRGFGQGRYIFKVLRDVFYRDGTLIMYGQPLEPASISLLMWISNNLRYTILEIGKNEEYRNNRKIFTPQKLIEMLLNRGGRRIDNTDFEHALYVADRLSVEERSFPKKKEALEKIVSYNGPSTYATRFALDNKYLSYGNKDEIYRLVYRPYRARLLKNNILSLQHKRLINTLEVYHKLVTKRRVTREEVCKMFGFFYKKGDVK